MITFENFSQLSSHAYFSYEMNLHLFDPILHNMVSEQYRCADYEEEDRDSVSDLDEDEETEEFVSDFLPRQELCFSDVLEYATTEKNVFDSGFIEFGSFYSAIVPKQVRFIEPVTDGYTINIGEISCFLVANDHGASVDALHSDQESHPVLESPTSESMVETLTSSFDWELQQQSCSDVSATEPRSIPPLWTAILCIPSPADQLNHSSIHHNLSSSYPSDIKNGERFWFDLILFATDLNHRPWFCNESTFIAKDLVRVSCFELVSEIAMSSSTKMIVERNDLTFATPPRSTFVFDPGGFPTHTAFAAVSTIKLFVSKFSVDLISIASDPIAKVLSKIDVPLLEKRAPPQHVFVVFDPGGVTAVSAAHRLLHEFQKPQEHPILVFDPGGAGSVFVSCTSSSCAELKFTELRVSRFV